MQSQKKIVMAFAVLTCLATWTFDLKARPSRPFYQAGRALMMGDAYTAVGTGFEAVYYNPAGLAKRNKPAVKIFDIETVASQGLLSLFSGSYTKFLNMSELLTDVASNPNTPYAIGVSVLPQFLVRNFSFGLLFRGQTEATFNSTTTNTDMYSFADLGVYTHYAAAFGGGVVKLGVGGKVINRAELERSYTAAEISAGALSFSEQWVEGYGLGVDAGIIITIPTTNLPAFALTVQDIGHTQFINKRLVFTGDTAPQGTPEAIPQRVNAGFSTIIKHGRGLRSVIAADYKDILSSATWTDKIHAGWEMTINQKLFLRAGVNQGRYWTAGLGIKLGVLGIELGSYGENLASPGEARQDDRRYVGRYVLSF